LHEACILVANFQPKRFRGPIKSFEAMKPFQKGAPTAHASFWKVSSLHMILLGRYIILVWVPTFRLCENLTPPPNFRKVEKVGVLDQNNIAPQ